MTCASSTAAWQPASHVYGKIVPLTWPTGLIVLIVTERSSVETVSTSTSWAPADPVRFVTVSHSASRCRYARNVRVITERNDQKLTSLTFVVKPFALIVNNT